jgi:hypothetical protein
MPGDADKTESGEFNHMMPNDDKGVMNYGEKTDDEHSEQIQLSDDEFKKLLDAYEELSQDQKLRRIMDVFMRKGSFDEEGAHSLNELTRGVTPLNPSIPELKQAPEKPPFRNMGVNDRGNIVTDLINLPANVHVAFRPERKANAILKGDYDKIAEIDKEDNGYGTYTVAGAILNDAMQSDNFQTMLGLLSTALSKRGAIVAGGTVLTRDIAKTITDSYEHAIKSGMNEQDARNAALEALKARVGVEVAAAIVTSRVKGPMGELKDFLDKNAALRRAVSDTVSDVAGGVVKDKIVDAQEKSQKQKIGKKAEEEKRKK